MRAARIAGYGGPEVLSLAEVDPPEPGPGQVLVDVAASCINPVDVAVRSGWMAPYLPVGPPLTLGVDVAGTVAAVGPRVSGFAVGTGCTARPGSRCAGPERSPSRPSRPHLVWPGSRNGPGWSPQGCCRRGGLRGAGPYRDPRRPGRDSARYARRGRRGRTPRGRARPTPRRGGHRHRPWQRGGGRRRLDVEVIDTDRTDLRSLPVFDATLDLVGQDPDLPVLLTVPGGRAVSLIVVLSFL